MTIESSSTVPLPRVNFAAMRRSEDCAIVIASMCGR
jgi:hypothetical protein